MNPNYRAHLKREIESGNVILFLGAGASMGSKNRNRETLASTTQIAQELAEESGYKYQNEPLDQVYAAAKSVLGPRLFTVLEKNFRHCIPSDEYLVLARYPWSRIYSTNIDDAYERAFQKTEISYPQELQIQTRKSQFVERDQTYSRLDFVKLHGSVDRLHEGIIFSSTEYALEAGNPSRWYSQLGHDYQSYCFIIIGTSLREPLFYQEVEYAKVKIHASSPRSYLVVPELTDIERASFKDRNIIHIKWTLSDFVSWIEQEFPRGLNYIDIAVNNNPSMKKLMTGNVNVKARRAKALIDVTQIEPKNIEKSNLHPGRIRDFYYGFKPSLPDIAENIPAYTDDIEKLATVVQNALKSDIQCLILFGPAGSGKSTAARVVAFELARSSKTSCYFIPGTAENIVIAIEELEKANDHRYIVLCDRLEPSVASIIPQLEKNKFPKLLLMGVESQNAWHDRIKQKFIDISFIEHQMSLISKNDVRKILSKLEQYGPWTSLAKINTNQREKLLYEKSKRQLLIGLLEATQGIGFEQIVERDYKGLKSDIHRKFLVIVGLASIHRLPLPISYASRILESLGIEQSPADLLKAMDGILHNSNGKLFARHPVYIRSLIESHIDTNQLSEIVENFIHAFTIYNPPIIKSLSRNEGHLYKKTINHRYLRGILRNNEERILGIYRSLEKYFEQDGLYWLQYGLALRHFGKHSHALEKLQTAVTAHEQAHTLHALAHQKLIIAMMETDTVRAENLAEQARETLERLHNGDGFSDAYPINLLARGYTAFVRKSQGDNNGRIMAKRYADRIYSLNRYKGDPHLQETWTLLTEYAVNGRWKSTDLSDIISSEDF